MPRIWYVMRKAFDADRRLWPGARHVIEPRGMDAMPPPDAFAQRSNR